MSKSGTVQSFILSMFCYSETTLQEVWHVEKIDFSSCLHQLNHKRGWFSLRGLFVGLIFFFNLQHPWFRKRFGKEIYLSASYLNRFSIRALETFVRKEQNWIYFAEGCKSVRHADICKIILSVINTQDSRFLSWLIWHLEFVKQMKYEVFISILIILLYILNFLDESNFLIMVFFYVAIYNVIYFYYPIMIIMNYVILKPILATVQVCFQNIKDFFSCNSTTVNATYFWRIRNSINVTLMFLLAP